MSGPYIDLYVLCPARTTAAAQQFLDAWAPRRVLSSDEDEPIDQRIDRLARTPSEGCRLYWQSGRTDEVEHVILAFTPDGGMIAGLSVSNWDRPRAQIAALLERLARSVGARHGYAAAEEAPVDSRAEMLAECARRDIAWSGA